MTTTLTPVPDLDAAVWLLLTDVQRMMDQVRDMVRALPACERRQVLDGYDTWVPGPDPVLESIMQGVASPC